MVFIELKKLVHVITTVLLRTMSESNYIVINQIIADKSFSIHCQIRVNTQEVELAFGFNNEYGLYWIQICFTFCKMY